MPALRKAKKKKLGQRHRADHTFGKQRTTMRGRRPRGSQLRRTRIAERKTLDSNMCCENKRCGCVHYCAIPDDKSLVVSLHWSQSVVNDSVVAQRVTHLRKDVSSLLKSESLRCGTTLQNVVYSIHVAFNSITAVGIDYLCRYLLADKQASVLRLLDISGNAIGDDGCIHLCKLLRDSIHPVSQISMRHCQVSTSGVECLLDALKQRLAVGDFQYPFAPWRAHASERKFHSVSARLPLWLDVMPVAFDVTRVDFVQKVAASGVSLCIPSVAGSSLCLSDSKENESLLKCGPLLCAKSLPFKVPRSSALSLADLLPPLCESKKDEEEADDSTMPALETCGLLSSLMETVAKATCPSARSRCHQVPMLHLAGLTFDSGTRLTPSCTRLTEAKSDGSGVAVECLSAATGHYAWGKAADKPATGSGTKAGAAATTSSSSSSGRSGGDDAKTDSLPLCLLMDTCAMVRLMELPDSLRRNFWQSFVTPQHVSRYVATYCRQHSIASTCRGSHEFVSKMQREVLPKLLVNDMPVDTLRIMWKKLAPQRNASRGSRGPVYGARVRPLSCFSCFEPRHVGLFEIAMRNAIQQCLGKGVPIPQKHAAAAEWLQWCKLHVFKPLRWPFSNNSVENQQCVARNAARIRGNWDMYSSHEDVKVFTLGAMLDRFDRGEYGLALPSEERTVILVPNTAILELENIKTKEGKYPKGTIWRVNQLSGDSGFLRRALSAGVVEYLPPLESDAVWKPSHHNDSKILERVATLVKRVGARNVALVTLDKNMYTLASNRSIPVVDLWRLNRILFAKGPSAKWSASLMREVLTEVGCMPSTRYPKLKSALHSIWTADDAELCKRTPSAEPLPHEACRHSHEEADGYEEDEDLKHASLETDEDISNITVVSKADVKRAAKKKRKRERKKSRTLAVPPLERLSREITAERNMLDGSRMRKRKSLPVSAAHYESKSELVKREKRKHKAKSLSATRASVSRASASRRSVRSHRSEAHVSAEHRRGAVSEGHIYEGFNAAIGLVNDLVEHVSATASQKRRTSKREAHLLSGSYEQLSELNLVLARHWAAKCKPLPTAELRSDSEDESVAADSDDDFVDGVEVVSDQCSDSQPSDGGTDDSGVSADESDDSSDVSSVRYTATKAPSGSVSTVKAKHRERNESVDVLAVVDARSKTRPVTSQISSAGGQSAMAESHAAVVTGTDGICDKRESSSLSQSQIDLEESKTEPTDKSTEASKQRMIPRIGCDLYDEMTDDFATDEELISVTLGSDCHQYYIDTEQHQK